MREYINSYKSKFSLFPEALCDKMFINDSTENILTDDEYYYLSSYDAISGEEIPIDETYFIVDIGHAHLPAVAYQFIKLRINVYFFIPYQTHPRMCETIAFFSELYTEKKTNFSKPRGYATLIDTHRHDSKDYGKTYDLLKNSFPSVDVLRSLGIKRVVYLNEGLFRTKLSYFPQDIEPIKKEYTQGDISFLALGINNYETLTRLIKSRIDFEGEKKYIRRKSLFSFLR